MRRPWHSVAASTDALAAVITVLIPTVGSAHAESNDGLRVTAG